MINQALNIANLLRQSSFLFLDEKEKSEEIEAEVRMFEQFQEEIKQGKNNG
jgi:hypothetical protein